MDKEYWIDADGYLVYGLREENNWESVAEIPQKHIEPLSKIIKTPQAIPAEGRYGREPEKVKPLAQYLDEYIEQELALKHLSMLYKGNSWQGLLKQALDAYESTEGVRIRIERV